MRSSFGPQPRTRRTREKLLRAFNELALTRGFAALPAGDIAACAGVGRSTLYVHFRGPLQLFEASLERLCLILAAAVRVDSPSSNLVPLLRHIRGQCARNPVLLEEPRYSIWSKSLARAITATLRRDPHRARHRPALPREWLAPVLAELMLAIIRRWLACPDANAESAGTIAAMLTAAAQRLIVG
jgi:AcrR family transcriptional regulator